MFGKSLTRDGHRAWSVEKRFKFIEEIKMRPLIWKPRTNSKNDFKIRMAQAEEVRLEIGEEHMSALDVFEKWRAMRDMYRTELRKCVRDSSYRSKWIFFDAMSFVRSTFRDRSLREAEPQCSEVEHIELPEDEEPQPFVHCGTRARSCPPEVDRVEKKMHVEEVL
uniref:MADF domain-containing protein n=1 Tax=Steinernema glaseri TaxID=37863 RepID=A0A1I8AHS5_9BILA